MTFSVLLLIVSPPESFYLFLHSKNRAGLFNRPEPVVCLNSPLLNGCTDPDIKDKGTWDVKCGCLFLCGHGIKSKER